MAAAKRQTGHIIAIIGVDGTGKSSLVKDLKERISERCIPASTEWCGFSDWTLLKLATRILRLRNASESACSLPDVQIAERNEKMLRNKFIRMTYFTAVGLDYVFQMIPKVVIPRKNGSIVICDRYYFDQVVSHSVEMDSAIGERILWMLYRLTLPEPSITFVVTVPVSVSLSRKKDIPNRQYVEKRRTMYTDIAEKKGFEVLNGLDSIKSNVDHVLMIMSKRGLLATETEVTRSDSKQATPHSENH